MGGEKGQGERGEKRGGGGGGGGIRKGGFHVASHEKIPSQLQTLREEKGQRAAQLATKGLLDEQLLCPNPVCKADCNSMLAQRGGGGGGGMHGMGTGGFRKEDIMCLHMKRYHQKCTP